MGVQAAILFASATVEQFIGFIRPVTPDIETSDWSAIPSSPATFFDKLDEVSHDSDTTYVRTGEVSDVCTDVSVDDFEITLSDPDSNPSASQTITVRVVARHAVTAGAVITRELRWVLKEGGTDRASAGPFNLSGSHQTFSDVLTQAQKDSISDWNAMTLRIETTLCVEDSSGRVRARVTQAEVQFAA